MKRKTTKFRTKVTIERHIRFSERYDTVIQRDKSEEYFYSILIQLDIYPTNDDLGNTINNDPLFCEKKPYIFLT